MNIIICDDQKEELEEIKKICEMICAGQDEVSCYISSRELCNMLLVEQPEVDLFILDIEMPEVDGLELKRWISELYIDTNIVFLTTHSEMMEKAFGKKVLGFLQKQDYRQRLEEIIRDVRAEYVDKVILTVPNDPEGRSVPKDKIVMILAEHIYSSVQLVTYYNSDKKKYEYETKLFRISLGKWEKLLKDDDFYRVGRKQIVHFKYVQRITDVMIMNTKEEISVPVRRIAEVKRAYNRYCARKMRCM